MKDGFPEVQGGGSLILAWQVKGKKVLVVGGGEVRAPFLPQTLFISVTPHQSLSIDLIIDHKPSNR